MCTAIFAFGIHPTLLFLLAFNRDEFFSRPFDGVHRWSEIPQIIAPRDLERNGTWLGLSTNGRISFLTNIRVPNPKPSPRSRGLLPVEFLTGMQTPTGFLSGLNLGSYAPLNFLAVQLFDDIEVAMLSSSQGHDPVVFSRGVHGVSNGRLNDPRWHKVERGKVELEKILQDMAPEDPLKYDAIFEEVLGNSIELQPGVCLPDTGVSEALERRMSPVRIKPFWHFGAGGLYGTVSQIVLAVWSNHTVEIHERIWSAEQKFQQQDLLYDLNSLKQPPSL